MMSQLQNRSVTLRGLEVFDALVSTGSLNEAARRLGLSPSAASQQLKNLEDVLGEELVDRSRRPLAPTPAGRAYLVHARQALMHLRQGAIELSLKDLGRLRSLEIGYIDDFDGEVMPRLAVSLAEMLPNCDMTIVTGPSHLLLEDLAQRRAELAIAARAPELPEGLVELPLLRDPFVLAVPRGFLPAAPESIGALDRLPLLRYEKSQLIGRQVAAHLKRLRLEPQSRIEIDSNQAMFGLVASGAGWAISTPLGYLRARRFHGQVDVHPLPFAKFSRTISLFHHSDWNEEISGIIGEKLRAILKTVVVEPGQAAMPWLGDALSVLSD